MTQSPVAPFELPSRRVTRCQPIKFGALTFFLHCGFHPVDGSVREIFISSKRETAAAVAMLTEQCIAHSHTMQWGKRLSDIEVRSDLMLEVMTRALMIERDESRSVMEQYAQMDLSPDQWRALIVMDDMKCAAALAGEAERVAAL